MSAWPGFGSLHILILSEVSFAARIRWLKFHHRPTDDFVVSQQVEILVDLLERDGLDGVADLVLSRQRHDLGQVSIVPPERTVKGLFARNPGEERDIDAVADKSHVCVVAADPQHSESHLHHLWSTGAGNDGVEI